jgi:2-dehydropantoate 2-reductase
VRIGVIGLGAIGGVVAARLAFDDYEIALAAGRHAGRLNEQGLRLNGGPWMRTRVFETLPADSYDLILLCTRTVDTEAALTPAVPFLAADGFVVCVQNGLPEERVAKLVGQQRTLGAVVGWSASMVAPGDYVITGGGKFTFGGMGWLVTPRMHEIEHLLLDVFPVRVTRNLAGARWSKLAINCAMSTIGALTGLSLGEWTALPAGRRLALRVVREVVDAAHARGVKLEAISGLRPDWLVQTPRAFGEAVIRLAALRRPAQRSGMIARLREGRSAGVEDLNELVDAPLNQRIVQIVREIESGARKMSPANLAELP